MQIGCIMSRQGRVLAISSDIRRRQQSEAKRRRILMLALVVIVFAVCWYVWPLILQSIAILCLNCISFH